MEIRFFLTREDIWHYLIHVYTQERRRTLWSMLLIYAILILLIFLSISFLSMSSSFSLVDISPILIILIVIPLIIVFGLRRTAAQGAGWGGEHVVSITPRGYQEKSDQGEGIRNWSAVKTIAQDKYNLYFIVNASSSRIVQAMVIPKRAFAAPQDEEMFLNQARHYWMNERQMHLQ